MPRPPDAPSVLLYDGDCAFCTRSVLFVYARDPRGRFRFASLQSPAGRALLRKHEIAPGEDTMVLVENGRASTRSTAALRAARRLRSPWSWLGALGFVVPRAVRDAVYRAIARRRHRLGGACPVPPPGLRARMLE